VQIATFERVAYFAAQTPRIFPTGFVSCHQGASIFG
jgi:hypothetical protein